MSISLTTELAKSAPPVAVTVSTYAYGMTANDIASMSASVLTSIYVVYQIYLLIGKQIRERKVERKKAQEAARAKVKEGDDVSPP